MIDFDKSRMRVSPLSQILVRANEDLQAIAYDPADPASVEAAIEEADRRIARALAGHSPSVTLQFRLIRMQAQYARSIRAKALHHRRKLSQNEA